MNRAWMRCFLILRGNYVETCKTNNKQQSDFLHISPLYIGCWNESPPFSLAFIRQKERRGGRSNKLEAFQGKVVAVEKNLCARPRKRTGFRRRTDLSRCSCASPKAKRSTVVESSPSLQRANSFQEKAARIADTTRVRVSAQVRNINLHFRSKGEFGLRHCPQSRRWSHFHAGFLHDGSRKRRKAVPVKLRNLRSQARTRRSTSSI